MQPLRFDSYRPHNSVLFLTKHVQTNTVPHMTNVDILIHSDIHKHDDWHTSNMGSCLKDNWLAVTQDADRRKYVIMLDLHLLKLIPIHKIFYTTFAWARLKRPRCHDRHWTYKSVAVNTKMASDAEMQICWLDRMMRNNEGEDPVQKQNCFFYTIILPISCIHTTVIFRVSLAD